VLQVTLGSEAPGARVEIDGELRGGAPITLGALTAGRHEVRVRANGFEDLVQVVDVAAESTTIVAAALRPVTGSAPVSEAVAREASVAADEERADEGATDREVAQPVLPVAPAVAELTPVRIVAAPARRARRATPRASAASGAPGTASPAAPTASPSAEPAAPEPVESLSDIGRDVLAEVSRSDLH
jgi:hypothetical protein